MSLFNPEIVPVTLYSWDDDDAPVLDKSAGCVATIFKACLVEGYGTKQPAGWTMPYEDMDAGVKVFRAAQSPDPDFYLRVSGDTGRKLTPEVYVNMTDINTGDLKLKCDTEFKYGAIQTNGKWVLVASSRGFWFFSEGSNGNDIPTNQSGSYIYCGETSKNTVGAKGIYLKHTGGTWGDTDDDRYHIFGSDKSGATLGKLYVSVTDNVYSENPSCFFVGASNCSQNTVLAQSYVVTDDIYPLALYSSSRNDKHNRDIANIINQRFLVHATGSYKNIDNQYIPLDNWVM